MNLCPWRDFAGNEIYAGDVICHPGGERGRVVFLADKPDVHAQWRVDYGDGSPLASLGLQIGDKGQAVVEKWSKARTDALTLEGALLTADSCVADGSDMYRIALKVLAHEYRKLRAQVSRTVPTARPSGE